MSKRVADLVLQDATTIPVRCAPDDQDHLFANVEPLLQLLLDRLRKAVVPGMVYFMRIVDAKWILRILAPILQFAVAQNISIAIEGNISACPQKWRQWCDGPMHKGRQR